MRIPRSTFYHNPKEGPLEKFRGDADLEDEIERICLEFPRYGYRRVTKQLHRRGWSVNHKRVLRLMRENDLLCRVRKKGIRTTNSNHSHPVFPNLIEDLSVISINQVLRS